MSALERVVEILESRPCRVGAPLLHALIDGELPAAKARRAESHVRRCERCREHRRFLELEVQTIREIAAPTPARFRQLWTERLLAKIAQVAAEESADEASQSPRAPE